MQNNNFHSSGAKLKIDQAMDILYAGGLPNPMDSIELISYLLFLKDLTEKENARSKISPKYCSSLKKDFKNCSWNYLLLLSGSQLIKSVRDAIEKIHQLPKMSETGKILFKKATLKITEPITLKALIEVINSLPEEINESDIQGDIYEYLLQKLSSSGTNGQFRTPRHIIDTIVKLVDPKIGDTICDPACGTGGFLISAHKHILRSNTSKETASNVYGDLLSNEELKFLETKAIWGFDNDANMVKFAALNLYLHKLHKAKIAYHNTLTSPCPYKYPEKFSIILANPPFAGKIQAESIQEDLYENFKSKATELLFLKWIIDHLENKGRCGVIVPNGLLSGSTKAHKSIRKELLEKCELEAVINLPSGIFKPYSGVSTSILIFMRGKPTKRVWFYALLADGFSLDSKREPIEKNDIPELLLKWNNKKELKNSFEINIEEISKNDWNLCINGFLNSRKKILTFECSPKSTFKKILETQKNIQKAILYLKKKINF
ncbi:MAG: N-6 DNA methylase [Chlamydiales bacterium]